MATWEEGEGKRWSKSEKRFVSLMWPVGLEPAVLATSYGDREWRVRRGKIEHAAFLWWV